MVRIKTRCSLPLVAICLAAAGLCASKLALTQKVDHLDELAREPMVVEHPDGTLFVSGYCPSPPKLWKSRDHGATWTRVNVGAEAQGAIGNSDVDLAIARDGTLYFAQMGFDVKTHEGTHIAMGVSRDAGATWHWTMLSKDRFDDRPWVAVEADGTAHAIWNDGSGVRHAISRDRGATWTERGRIHDKGGSSHLVVGPKREIAVRITPLSASGNKFDPGVDLIAVSTDGGETWKKHPPPGNPQWSASVGNFPPRWVEPLAWDAGGALYAFWTEPNALWLARSTDQGETWKTWQLASPKEPWYFPYLVARGRGELAATWFSGRGENLQAHVGELHVSTGDAAPRLVESDPFQFDSWRGDPLTRNAGGEYIGITFLRRGGVGVVTPIQNQHENRLGFTWWKFEAR